MSMRNQTKIKIVLILAAVALAVFAGPAQAGVPTPTGINPATGNPWANGDTYRLAFFTSASHDALSADIATYNTWVQGLADDSTVYDIGADDGVTWKAIGSTPTVDARDNTSTNPTVETGCPILLLDGSTLVANDNADLWDGEIQNIINITEQGTVSTHWPFTGTYTDGTSVTGKPTSFSPLGGGANVNQGNSGDVTLWIWRTWTSAPAADPLQMYALSDPLVVGGGGPTNPYPDGITVPVGDVDLSWTNMDPNTPGDPVYVDVWFGTEPNELDPGYDMIKVVTANIGDPDRSTWTVSAPTEGTYYWRVDSYINGNPSGDPIKGSVWSFYAKDDAPPSSVDAGISWITWSGQAVELDATVVDDGKSALTYAWSADPSAGVVFDPSAAVEDPTVTITKAPGDAVTVTLTLAVHDEGNPTPVEDTMTIDVYDDACLAALGAGVATIDPGDIDGNCITDLRDYAILAADWLVDNALTAPIVKP